MRPIRCWLFTTINSQDTQFSCADGVNLTETLGSICATVTNTGVILRDLTPPAKAINNGTLLTNKMFFGQIAGQQLKPPNY